MLGFAPAGSITGVRLMATALMAAGVFAVGLLGPATASADGVNNCSNTTVNVVCIGEVNGDVVTVNVGDVGIGNNVTALTNNLNNAVLQVANITDLNILSAELHALVQTAVNTFVQTLTNVTTKNCVVTVAPPVTPTGNNTIAIACS